MNVKEGEYLLAVNGREVHGRDEIFSFFQETAGKAVQLKVGSDPSAKGARNVTVVPIADERSLRLHAWMEANRRKVRAAAVGATSPTTRSRNGTTNGAAASDTSAMTVRVLAEVGPALARPGAQQPGEVRVGADLVVEHRAVVRVEHGVAARERSRPASRHAVAVAAAAELAELDADREPGLEPVGARASEPGDERGEPAGGAHRAAGREADGRGEEQARTGPGCLRSPAPWPRHGRPERRGRPPSWTRLRPVAH